MIPTPSMNFVNRRPFHHLLKLAVAGLALELSCGLADAVDPAANPPDFALVHSGRTTPGNGAIELPYDLLVGRHEVTFDEYDAFTSETKRQPASDRRTYNPGRAMDETLGDEKEVLLGKGNRPVINVTWTDAVEYANWLSEKKGLEPAYGKNEEAAGGYSLKNLPEKLGGYRLLTGYEWEYAARGGADGRATVYSGGDDLKEVGWFNGNSGFKPQPVGSLKANALGIHDMSGNVSEWVNTRSRFAAYAVSEQYRAHRGGAWYASDTQCKPAHVEYVAPKTKLDCMGFRLARTVLAKVDPVKKTYPRSDVGNSKNNEVTLALATRAEANPERVDIALEALSLIHPKGTINLTRDCDLFDFINDPGPAALKHRAMPADRHLVLNSMKGRITDREVNSLRDYYLEYINPATNLRNYHFQRWYVPFMAEWIYNHAAPEDKTRILNTMIDMGRGVMANRNDRIGKFISQFGDVAPGWPHYQHARIAPDGHLEVGFGISDFGYSSWASMSAKIIASNPQIWNEAYNGKSYREIANELIADSLVTIDYALDKYLNRTLMLYTASTSTPFEGSGRLIGWNREFKFMVSTLPLIDALEKFGLHPEKRALIDRANGTHIEEFWKYARWYKLDGKPLLDYPTRVNQYISTDIGHAGFESDCLQLFFHSGRYAISAEQITAYANTLVKLSAGKGKFSQRFDGGGKAISPGSLPAFIFYAQYNPALFDPVVQYLWEAHGKGEADPGSKGRVVWEILKLKEQAGK